MNKISFDGVNLSNKNDIYDKCSDPNDAEAIFQFLVTGNKVLGDAPDIYFFIDAVTYIVLDEYSFLYNGLIDISDFSLTGKIIFYLKTTLFDIFENIFRLKNNVIEMKLTGAFKISPPFSYENNPDHLRLVTTDCSYIGGKKIVEETSFIIMREYLDEDKATNELFPFPSYFYRDADGQKHHSYCHESVIDDYIEHYHGGYDGSRFVKTESKTFYDSGNKVVMTDDQGTNSVVECEKEGENFEHSQKKDRLIIAALTEVLKNSDRPFINSNEDITNHFQKYFNGIKGLSYSNFTKIIADANQVLKAEEEKQGLEATYNQRYKAISKKVIK